VHSGRHITKPPEMQENGLFRPSSEACETQIAQFFNRKVLQLKLRPGNRGDQSQ